MRIAERVTFGGSGLDRAADLRPAAFEIAQGPDAAILPMWKGKPLVRDDGADVALVAVPAGNTALEAANEPPVLLGRNAGKIWFAQDISGWVPEGQETASADTFLDPTEQRFPGMPNDHRFVELRSKMTRLTARDAELAATGRAVLTWHRSHGFCSNCGAKSEMAEAGWQRHCPACGARHFPRTDPVVIMLVTHGNSVLVGRSPQWPEGMYSLLAGFVEPGETIEAAVRREVQEEAGVHLGSVGYLASQPWPFPASLMLGCRAEAKTTQITLDPVELQDARWVTREEMMAVFAKEDTSMKPAREGAIAHFLIQAWLADRLD